MGHMWALKRFKTDFGDQIQLVANISETIVHSLAKLSIKTWIIWELLAIAASGAEYMFRLASSSTLMEGMDAVRFAEGKPSAKRTREELEEMIRATRLHQLWWSIHVMQMKYMIYRYHIWYGRPTTHHQPHPNLGTCPCPGEERTSGSPAAQGFQPGFTDSASANTTRCLG